MKSLLLPAILLATCLSVRAVIITAATQLVADVQTAINNASNGDTVVVPAGSATWASGITIPNTKGITLDGTGAVITRGGTTAALVTISPNATTTTRLTGFRFNLNVGAPFNYVVTVGGGFSNAKFRIDHCVFYSTAGQTIFITVYNSWGLIDHCTLSGDSASEMIHNEAWGASSTAGWSEDIIPGSIDALYIEDCIFSKTNQTDPYFWGTSALQSYYGARTVVRHNTFNYCQVDQHGTAGVIGCRWWEIYENDFFCPNNSGQSNWMAIRAGSGVIFNNRMHVGSGAVNPFLALLEEDLGYPALYQIGRGKNQVLDPAYCWNNDRLPGAGSSNVVDGRDFFSNTVKPGYTPFVYPHPMNVSATVPPTIATVQITTP